MLLFMPTLCILTQSPEPSYAVTSWPSGTLERWTRRGPGWLKSFAVSTNTTPNFSTLRRTYLRIRIIWVTSTVAVRTVVEHAIYPFHWLVPLVRDLNSVSSFYGQDLGLLRMRHVISAASLRLREIDVEGRPVPATVQEVGAAGGYPLVVWVGLISFDV